MSATKRELAVVNQLLRETQEGKLKWRALDPHADTMPWPGAETRVLESYAAVRGEYALRLCRYTDREYTDVDEWRLIESVQLETGKRGDAIWWTFPPVNSAWDLLKAVQFQVTKVGDFFANVLGDGGEDGE